MSGALSGCAFQKYRAAPLSPQAMAASLQSRTLNDAGLRSFVENIAPSSTAAWPVPQWDLGHLTLAAFYFNPALDIARTRVAEAEAAVVTAGARPNPSIGGNLGGETSPESPWITGLGFSLPIETAGKRRDRRTAAERQADVARWDLATTAWSVRAHVRSALVESLTAARSLALVRTEERIRAEQVHLMEQRLAVGMIPRPDVDAARIQHTHTLLAARTAEGRLSQAHALLAAAIGIPAASLDRIELSWPQFDQSPSAASLTGATIQQDAVLDRLDIRRALADYAASEASLRLEIAKQYPDVDLGPTYAFEEAIHLFSIAASLTLPVFNRNQGPIAEALARRQEMAARFLSTQAEGIALSEQALAKYTAALNELAQARQLMQQLQAQEETAQAALRAGQGDRVRLNAAHLQTAVAAIARLDALNRAQQALGELENAVQRPLLPGDIHPLSPQSVAIQSAARK
jgi:outer membrane protein TolC